MKRSEINEILLEGDAFIRSHGFIMPPFAYFTPEIMGTKRDTAIVQNSMGWDITDYGQGDYENLGLFLFTVRNGRAENLSSGKGMLYAEKIMISKLNQLSPMHRHNIKAEDIINRGGGKLVLELFVTDQDGNIDRTSDFEVPVDGQMRKLKAGDRLALDPGESVTLMPHIWHAFWAEGKDCLIGEVSTVNDDLTDNVFEAPIGRFSTVDEDIVPVHLLVSDYEKWVK